MKKKELTLKEFAKMGGEAIKKKYGTEYYKKIGKSGAKARWSKKVIHS